MGLNWILEPLDGDDICGPDLDETEDETYLDYYDFAQNRLPLEYVTTEIKSSKQKGRDTYENKDQCFDPNSIGIASENKAIDGLLKRSRDLRLLVLKAKWECLAGRIEKAAEVVVCIADLLEAHGDHVHPAVPQESAARKDALNGLSDSHTIVWPLRFAGLVGTSEVTLRKLKLAQGDAKPWSFESEITLDSLQASLGQPSQRKKVDAAHTAVVTMANALERIKATCNAQEHMPFTPNFGELPGVLADISAAITDARPDLRGAEIDIQSGPRTTQPDDGTPTGAGQTNQNESGAFATPQSAAMERPANSIESHKQASNALKACEVYFHTNEPSSASVLLITQARLLIGRPLIETLETLLPEVASKTIVEFGPQVGFQLNIDRLRSLTSEASSVIELAKTDDSPDQEPVKITSSAEAALTIREVERFFIQKEKSSAVPVLLKRARSYLDKDFQALVDELLPQK